jgi:hypothetical protein
LQGLHAFLGNGTVAFRANIEQVIAAFAGNIDEIPELLT